jgi:hypothetical protein
MPSLAAQRSSRPWLLGAALAPSMAAAPLLCVGGAADAVAPPASADSSTEGGRGSILDRLHSDPLYAYSSAGGRGTASLASRPAAVLSSRAGGGEDLAGLGAFAALRTRDAGPQHARAARWQPLDDREVVGLLSGVSRLEGSCRQDGAAAPAARRDESAQVVYAYAALRHDGVAAQQHGSRWRAAQQSAALDEPLQALHGYAKLG